MKNGKISRDCIVRLVAARMAGRGRGADHLPDAAVPEQPEHRRHRHPRRQHHRQLQLSRRHRRAALSIVDGRLRALARGDGQRLQFPRRGQQPALRPDLRQLGGILRVTGTFVPATGQPDRSYIFDSAAAPGQQYTTLVVPGAVNTIAHSQFGNQVVGNYNTTTPAGSAFIYDIVDRQPSRPTTGRGRPALGLRRLGQPHRRRLHRCRRRRHRPRLHLQPEHRRVHPVRRAGRHHRHAFRGHHRRRPRRRIQPGRGLDRPVGGSHAWAVHVDAAGVATWTELKVPGATSTSGNSIYEDKAIGIFVQGGIVRAYIATVPGLYNPMTNTGTLIANTTGATALSATNGDDVVNSGTIVASAPNSMGIASGNYGVIQNRGTIVASGAGQRGGADERHVRLVHQHRPPDARPAAPSRWRPAPRRSAPTIVNSGIIDGQVAVAGGPFTRFQNSGWMGISAAGSGVTAHDQRRVSPRPRTACWRCASVPRRRTACRSTARRDLNGTALANFQPGTLGKSYTLLHGDGRLHRHVQHACDAEPAGVPQCQPELWHQRRDAEPDLGLRQHLGPGRRPDLGRPRARLRLQRRRRAQRHAGPVQPVVEPASLGAQPALGRQRQPQPDRGLRRRRPVHQAHERSRRPRAAPRSWRQAPCAKTQAATACEPPSELGGVGQRLRRHAVAQRRFGDRARPPRRPSIAGGAFGADYRFAPRPLVGLAVGLSDSNLLDADQQRDRPGDRHACRPLRRPRLVRLLSQRGDRLQPLRRQCHARRHRHRHDRDGEIVRRLEPACRPGRGRPAVQCQRVHRRAGRASRRSSPCSPRSSGRRA